MGQPAQSFAPLAVVRRISVNRELWTALEEVRLQAHQFCNIVHIDNPQMSNHKNPETQLANAMWPHLPELMRLNHQAHSTSIHYLPHNVIVSESDYIARKKLYLGFSRIMDYFSAEAKKQKLLTARNLYESGDKKPLATKITYNGAMFAPIYAQSIFALFAVREIEARQMASNVIKRCAQENPVTTIKHRPSPRLSSNDSP